MEVTVEIAEYDRRRGIQFTTDESDVIRVDARDNTVRIVGDASGLTSLAGYLLALAQPGVPDGAHIHLDEFSGRPSGSTELILERGSDRGI